MNGFESIRTCFRKYFDFKGRARRSEFWWFQLFVAVGGFALSFADEALFQTTYAAGFEGSYAFDGIQDIFAALWGYHHLSNVFFYGTLVPLISVSARRLHDIGLSTWRLLGLLVLSSSLGTFLLLPEGKVFTLYMVGILGLLLIYAYWFTKKSDPIENKYGVSPKPVSAP